MTEENGEKKFEVPEGRVLLCVSEETYETLAACAKEFGEEMFRRFVFDNPGMNPKALEVARENIINRVAADCYDRVLEACEHILKIEGAGHER